MKHGLFLWQTTAYFSAACLLLPALLFLLCAPLAAQQQGGALFYIDSAAVTGEVDPYGQVLQPAEVAVYRTLTNKDSIRQLRLGSRPDTVVFIITKAFEHRPDSLKRIPSLKRLLLRNNRLYTDTLKGPYTGPFTDYYFNGARKTSGNILNGQIEGYANVYYPDGSLMESHYYQHSNEDGMREEYFPTGVIKCRGRYKDGLMEGYWQEWYSTGKLKKETYYLHSTPHYPDRENVFFETLDEAVAQLQEGQWSNALEALNQCREINPDYEEVAYYLGNIYLAQKKYDRAVAFYSQALALEPLNTAAHIQRAHANRQLLQNAIDKKKEALQASLQQSICEDLRTALQQGSRDKIVRQWMQELCIAKQ